jgi:protein-disulfide isomerase
VHDRFFTMQRDGPSADWRALALAEGADAVRLDQCVGSAGAQAVHNDIADARRLGIAGTPFFYVGRPATSATISATHSINGARPFETFQAVIAEVRRGRS